MSVEPRPDPEPKADGDHRAEQPSPKATKRLRRKRLERDQDRLAHRLRSDGPDHPLRMPFRAWMGAVKRTVLEFQEDGLGDWAAALTYYSVLSIFPALLVVTSMVGLAGGEVSQKLIDNLAAPAPGAVREVLTQALFELENSKRSAGLVALIAILGGLWSASKYVAAFMRASNAVYDIHEGRPLWKTFPIRVAITLATLVLMAVSAVAVVVSGPLAHRIGDLLGLGDLSVMVWNVLKWPVLLIVINVLFALLYWAAPNARQGIRWITPGGLLALLVWLLASLGFAVYVSGFAAYNKTYGSLAALIIFLVWLWIANAALLLGAEFNAELERARAIESGNPPGKEPYVRLRDLPD
ncbi:YihY/virulence factor BrkB family protein [Actinocorallia longicatena]|uniref:YihY/virulence factor BrkB family protein n=1 Tax=Actinocorallia longicatena TaxID=111803 RepID=A0ABP6QLC9_9ACTN